LRAAAAALPAGPEANCRELPTEAAVQSGPRLEAAPLPARPPSARRLARRPAHGHGPLRRGGRRHSEDLAAAPDAERPHAIARAEPRPRLARVDPRHRDG